MTSAHHIHLQLLYSLMTVFYAFVRGNVWGELWSFSDAAGQIVVFLQGVANTAFIQGHSKRNKSYHCQSTTIFYLLGLDTNYSRAFIVRKVFWYVYQGQNKYCNKRVTLGQTVLIYIDINQD